MLPPNPYDFSHPVNDRELFIGRDPELTEIKYYLDHAVRAARPMSLAILGPRASGKTSLLNMTEIEARRRDMCVARVDLDEGVTHSHLNLFFKLFDAVLTAACELGAFGGLGEKTYEQYLEIVNTAVIPTDKTFCPFIFPLQYALAMSHSTLNAELSDQNYKRDLAIIRAELHRPVAILFDECNVLAESRIHLEKLRNIFMNLSGFMLVLTGTPDLFPIINEVFSPIVRQFKKISLGAFQDREETRSCITRPLIFGEIKQSLHKLFGPRPEGIFDEIHDLSGGRPYEVQLICHMLYRRLEQQRAKTMELSLGSLEDVRRELETSEDISSRPILKKVRQLPIADLQILGMCSICDGNASSPQVWAMRSLLGQPTMGRKEFEEGIQRLSNLSVLKSTETGLKFRGDDFDKVYTKYFAREQKVSCEFQALPPQIRLHIGLRNLLLKYGLNVLNLDRVDLDLDLRYSREVWK
jgi:hypothetical protein